MLRTSSQPRTRPARNSGFTLVELLVVITIIGILMGLLIPAVQMAREAARRNSCATQINNLCKGAIQYEMAKQRYPGWVERFGVFNGGSNPSDDDPSVTYPAHPKLGTWVVALLPYLEAQPSYEVWTQDKYPIFGPSGFTAAAAPNLPIMQCPTTEPQGERARNSYIANNGMHHGAVVTFEQSMSRNNGVFNSKVALVPGWPAGPSVRADDLKDGQGNTVLFSENAQALPWAFTNLTGAASEFDLASRFAQGMVWHFEDPKGYGGAPLVDPAHKINGHWNNLDPTSVRMNAANAPHVARPSSDHVSGVNMGFADGTTRFVADSIDYRVFQAYMTPRGKSSNVPFTEYVLENDN